MSVVGTEAGSNRGLEDEKSSQDRKLNEFAYLPSTMSRRIVWLSKDWLSDEDGGEKTLRLTTTSRWVRTNGVPSVYTDDVNEGSSGVERVRQISIESPLGFYKEKVERRTPVRRSWTSFCRVRQSTARFTTDTSHREGTIIEGDKVEESN